MAVESERVDAVVIGCGVFGCVAALELREHGKTVLLLDRGDRLLARASYCNQARIHQGYHYPRSILTAHRSRVNFNRFVEDYGDCVISDFDKYYAIGRSFSKITAAQFIQFCSRIGAPASKAPSHIHRLFAPSMIEGVFKVREYAFDAVKLRTVLKRQLDTLAVDIRLNATVTALQCERNGVTVKIANVDGSETLVSAGMVFNCTYSSLNKVLSDSHGEIIPLKHEMTEIAFLQPPDELQGIGVTVMDGPFFSFMPFPARQLHSLSHVRYTPHYHWWDKPGAKLINIGSHIANNPNISRYRFMQNDAARYIPALATARYVDSMWEIKTLLPRSETDDGRPILFHASEKNSRVISILGGKVDNLYDIRDRLRDFLKSSRGLHEN